MRETTTGRLPYGHTDRHAKHFVSVVNILGKVGNTVLYRSKITWSTNTRTERDAHTERQIETQIYCTLVPVLNPPPVNVCTALYISTISQQKSESYYCTIAVKSG